jgi:probable F420-dependent oxidoreductase
LEFGTTVNPGGDLAGSARAVEAAGFDYMVCGEHLLFHDGATSALVTLAAASSVTTTIRLVSGVVLTPLYPAAMLAWLAMSLDRVSGGRLELGMGVGGEFPKEFEAVGIDPKVRGARTDETLEVMRLLWSSNDVSFTGRFNRFEHVSLQPKPVQSKLPIWVAGRQSSAMARAARFADGWMPYMYSAERLAESIKTIRSLAEEAGRDPSAIRPSIYAMCTVYEDGAHARQVAGELVSHNYRQDLKHVVDRYLIAGSPADCRRRLREYADAGAEVAFLPMACPPADRDAMLRLLSTEVIPDLHSNRTGQQIGAH